MPKALLVVGTVCLGGACRISSANSSQAPKKADPCTHIARFMTMECEMDANGKAVRQSCSVQQTKKFPERSYICGKGPIKYKIWLCDHSKVKPTSQELEQVVCKTLAETER